MDALAQQLADMMKDHQELMRTNQELLKKQQSSVDGQQAQIKSLQETVSQLGTVIAGKSDGPPGTFVPPDKMAALANLMETFVYDPESNLTFEAWFDRYEDVFEVDGSALGDSGKVRLLLMKLDTPLNEQYRHSLLPVLPSKVPFKDTVASLKSMFAKKYSLFRTRWDCLQVNRRPDEPLTAYGARVNKLAESFLLQELTPDQFKCLLFIQGIHDPRDKNIRTRLPNLFDKADKGKCVLREMMDEAERILRIESDTTLGNSPSINQLQRPASNQSSKGKSFGKKQFKRKSGRPSDVPPSPCWQCGCITSRTASTPNTSALSVMLWATRRATAVHPRTRGMSM